MVREISYGDALSLQEEGTFRHWLAKHDRKFGKQYPLLKKVIRSFKEDTIEVQVEPCAEMLGMIRSFSGITLSKIEVKNIQERAKPGQIPSVVYRPAARYVVLDYRTYRKPGCEHAPGSASATFVRK